MKNILKKLLVVFSVQILQLATASAANLCESVSSIKAKAADEVCDYFVDAAEDCFTKLNKELIVLSDKASKNLTSVMKEQAQSLITDYLSAVSSLESYRKNMSVRTCGDQRVRVRVMIDEIRTDLKELSALISGAKIRK